MLIQLNIRHKLYEHETTLMEYLSDMIIRRCGTFIYTIYTDEI